MIGVIQDFEDRVVEVESYFSFLNDLHEQDVYLGLPNKRRLADRKKSIATDTTSILKANSFLLLYNIVESSLREGILAIYNELERENYTYSQIRSEIKDIWSRFEFKKSFDINSSWNTYYSKAMDILQQVRDSRTIAMDRNAIPVSGNLDADQIRLICDMHGIKKNVHANAKGGRSLGDIKDQRNLLAHGSLAFSDCGRQFELSQLNDIKKETIIFMRSILRNMKEYHDEKKYELVSTTGNNA